MDTLLPWLNGSSQRSWSVTEGLLKNFEKFTGKHLCQGLSLKKIAGWDAEAWNFMKKETLTQVFSCEFCEIYKNTFFTEHLRAIASG